MFLPFLSLATIFFLSNYLCPTCLAVFLHKILSEAPSNYLPRLISLGQAPPGAPSSSREVKLQQRSLRDSFLALTAAGHSSALTASCPSPRSPLYTWFCSSGVLYRFGLVLSNQLAPVFVFARSQSGGIFLLNDIRRLCLRWRGLNWCSLSWSAALLLQEIRIFGEIHEYSGNLHP